MKTPRFIQMESVLKFHKMSLAEHGGSDGIRDMGMLESALGKPRNVYAYNQGSTIFDLAASYAYGIAKNHPFVDGNKRTALVTCDTFLEKNGYIINASNEETYKTFYLLAAGQVSERSLSRWLELNCKKVRKTKK
jgi:death-on-curing protein